MQPLRIICILLAITSPLFATATMEDDEKECADQMANMATCIPYVSGTAKMPTKECCQDSEKVRAVKPKCLCVLIKESTDPSLGLPINTTLALQMPGACKSDAKVSDCPKLLNLPADSPDAKIFKLGGADPSTDSTTTSPSDSSTKTPSSASTAASSSSDTKTTPAAAATSNAAKTSTSSILLFGMVLASVSLMLLKF